MNMSKPRNNNDEIMNLDRISKCFHNSGILIDELNGEELLSELLEDSLEFITFIVEVEQEFDIEISDEYFQPGQLECVADVANMISILFDAKAAMV